MQNLDIFKSEKRESTVDYIINTIKSLLLERKLKPGDMLPSEGALSESMQVSRGSVREAMKILSAFGIVEIKRGDGTYIAAPSSKSIIDPFLFKLVLSGADAREMAELREILETQIVSLIIKNGTEQDIEALEQVHLDMKEAYSVSSGSNAREMIKYDLSFHSAMGHAANNILVEEIYNFTMDLFTPYIERTYNYEKNGMTAILLHEGIVQAIKERDISKAIEATQKSIKEWRLIFSENHR